jgi:molecular chaperone Hsp33
VKRGASVCTHASTTPNGTTFRILAETVKATELVDSNLAIETLLWRLFHEEEEIRLLSSVPLKRGCRCDADHVRRVLARFDEQERVEMAGEDGVITVDCEFCSRKFPIGLGELDG